MDFKYNPKQKKVDISESKVGLASLTFHNWGHRLNFDFGKKESCSIPLVTEDTNIPKFSQYDKDIVDYLKLPLKQYAPNFNGLRDGYFKELEYELGWLRFNVVFNRDKYSFLNF